MKRVLCIVYCMVLVSLTGSLRAEQILYVYRSDSVINAFYTFEIDSIRYSNYDLDSVLHDTCQLQEIWTADSVYRVPLTIIDSVSFITPQTVYKAGIINLSDSLMNYIIACDSMTIIIDSKIPQRLLPTVGTKLVTLEMSEIFPIGFAGQVESVSSSSMGFCIECKNVALGEIFDTYYNLSLTCGQDIKPSKVPQKSSFSDGTFSGEHTFHLPQFSWDQAATGFSLSQEVSKTTDRGALAIGMNSSITCTITPTIYVKTFLQISGGETYFSYRIQGDIVNEETISIGGQINYSKDFSFVPKLLGKVPLSQFVYFYYDFGLFLNLNVKASYSVTSQQRYLMLLAGDYSKSGRNVIKPTREYINKERSVNTQGGLEGSLGLGVYAECGLGVLGLDFDFTEDDDNALAKVGIRAETGVEASGGFVMYQEELEDAQTTTAVYDRAKESNINLDFAWNISLMYKLLALEGGVNTPINGSLRLNSWDVVPKFSNVSFLKTQPTSAKVGFDINGKCLAPVSVSATIFDNGNEMQTLSIPTLSYKNQPQSFETTISLENSNSTNYIVHPKVSWMGIDLLASPSAPLDEKKWVILDNFDITDSVYSPTQAFVYENQNYYYKFDCSITVGLDTAGCGVNVIDWGYAYVGLSNDTSYISLSGQTNPYTDNRYTYYRNVAYSSLKLVGYVVFSENPTEKLLQEPNVFELHFSSCVDNNHQHMVDLGLSSGTLWACMNLGASKPEDVGDYYAFGETATKSNFSQNNHWWFVNNGGYSYYQSVVPVNISGTIYDAATYIWQNDWRIPTKQEIQELLDSCTWTLISRNSVQGYEVTGKNGNSIFLPFAPSKSESTTGSVCHYRSSCYNSQSLGNIHFAGSDAISFTLSRAPYLGNVFRYMGALIRPVKSGVPLTQTEQ